MSYVHPHVERVEWPTVARSPLPVESSKPPLQGSRLAHLHGPARIRLKEAALLGARQAEFWESHTRALADFKHARQQALHYPSSQQPSPRPSSSTARTPRASSARQHRPAAAHNSPFSAPTIQARAALQGKVDDAHRRLNAIMSRLEQTTTDQAAARQSACIGAISAEITSARGSPRVAVGSPRTHPLSNRATMLPVPLDSTATLHGMDMGVRRPESPRARPESPRARPASPRAALVDAPSTPAPRPSPTPPAPRLRPGVTPEELRRAQNLLRDRITDRHSNLHRAFRSADRDASGYISRDELIALVGRLNLGFAVREPVLDTLIDLMDVENDLEDDLDEGPTDISYREFARALTSADVMNMPTFAPTGRRAPEISDEARRMVRRGVRPDDLRRAQAVIKRMILTKFSQFTKAFKWIDRDRTGSITREELVQALRELNILDGLLQEEVVENVIDFMDAQGDGIIEYREFSRVLAADDVMVMGGLTGPIETYLTVPRSREPTRSTYLSEYTTY